MSTNKTFDVNAWVRPNIQAMQPYSSARDEFHGTASVFLDANENPYNTPHNRYPDPMQCELKTLLSKIKKVLLRRISQRPKQITQSNATPVQIK